MSLSTVEALAERQQIIAHSPKVAFDWTNAVRPVPDEVVEEGTNYPVKGAVSLVPLLEAERYHIAYELPTGRVNYDYELTNVLNIGGEDVLHFRRVRGRCFSGATGSSLAIPVSEFTTADYQVTPLLEVKPGVFRNVRKLLV